MYLKHFIGGDRLEVLEKNKHDLEIKLGELEGIEDVESSSLIKRVIKMATNSETFRIWIFLCNCRLEG